MKKEDALSRVRTGGFKTLVMKNTIQGRGLVT